VRCLCCYNNNNLTREIIQFEFRDPDFVGGQQRDI
jgi:hypothetical protein